MIPMDLDVLQYTLIFRASFCPLQLSFIKSLNSLRELSREDRDVGGNSVLSQI